MLVVDDQPGLNEMLGALLANHGICCQSALSGAEALRMYAARDFTAVLADWHMAPMDGITLTHKLRYIDPCARVLLMTGSPDPTLDRQAAEAGVTALLRKPFDPKTLPDLINRSANTSPPPT
ncbi:MAG: response regulator [Verrucomicrobiota bacterium]